MMDYSERYRAAGDAEKASPLTAAAEETIHARIERTLAQWVEEHPSPETPALSLAEMGEFSPRQILHAVQSKTDVGQFVEVLIVNGVRLHPDGIEGVLRTFLEDKRSNEFGVQSAMSGGY